MSTIYNNNYYNHYYEVCIMMKCGISIHFRDFKAMTYNHYFYYIYVSKLSLQVIIKMSSKQIFPFHNHMTHHLFTGYLRLV